MKTTRTILLLATLLLAGPAAGQEPSYGHQAPPADQLAKEHRITGRLVEAEKLRAGGEVSPARLADFHDFFTNFVDACHHRKEEQWLFPVALLARPELAETVRTLRLHHDIGQDLLRNLDHALAIWETEPEAARAEAAFSLDLYLRLLRHHIQVEEPRLIQPAEQALDSQQRSVAREGFHHVENEELGEGFHERYHALAMELLGEKTR